MADCIERKTLLRHLDDYISSPPELCYKFEIVKSIEEYVKNQPAANVREDVRGEWLQRRFFSSDVICSLCGTLETNKDSNYKSRFCPHCGARMGV